MAINLMGSGIDGSTYKLLKEGITASNLRSKTISNNMANINTENYKKFDVIFEDNLNKTMDSNFSLKKTKNKHMDNEDSFGNISIKRDNSTSMREDGNNVDLEVEKANQAANTLKYSALIQQANAKLTNTKYVINGGA